MPFAGSAASPGKFAVHHCHWPGARLCQCGGVGRGCPCIHEPRKILLYRRPCHADAASAHVVISPDPCVTCPPQQNPFFQGRAVRGCGCTAKRTHPNSWRQWVSRASSCETEACETVLTANKTGWEIYAPSYLLGHVPWVHSIGSHCIKHPLQW